VAGPTFSDDRRCDTVDEANIRARVRRMVKSAEIPCDVELSATTYRLHRVCFAIWEEECEPVPPAGLT
jgi:hypothetical protein